MSPSADAMESLKRSKRHRRVRQQEYDTVLAITIHSAQGIDPETTDPNGDKRLYFVAGCVNHVAEFWTPRAEGLPDPRWNCELRLPVEGATDEGSGFGLLNLEVVRTGSRSDPGPSDGDVLVGRARIELPKNIEQKKKVRVGLVRPTGKGCVAQGFIFITMEVVIISKHWMEAG